MGHGGPRERGGERRRRRADVGGSSNRCVSRARAPRPRPRSVLVLSRREDRPDEVGSAVSCRRPSPRRPALRATAPLAAEAGRAAPRARRGDRPRPQRTSPGAGRLSGRRGGHLTHRAAGGGSASPARGAARHPLDCRGSGSVAAAARTVRCRRQFVLPGPAAVPRAAGRGAARRGPHFRDPSRHPDRRRGPSGPEAPASAGGTPAGARRLGRPLRERRPVPRWGAYAGARTHCRPPAARAAPAGPLIRYSGSPTANSGSFGFVAGVVTVKSTIPDAGALISARRRPK